MGNIQYCIFRLDNYKESDTQSTWHTNAKKFIKVSEGIIVEC